MQSGLPRFYPILSNYGTLVFSKRYSVLNIGVLAQKLVSFTVETFSEVDPPYRLLVMFSYLKHEKLNLSRNIPKTELRMISGFKHWEKLKPKKKKSAIR